MQEKTLGEVNFETWWQSTDQLDNLQRFENAAQAVIAEYERRRWMPIETAHEDFSACVFINMRDPGTFYAGTVLDDDWADMALRYQWTHFYKLQLSQETAEALLAELPAGPEVGNEPA